MFLRELLLGGAVVGLAIAAAPALAAGVTAGTVIESTATATYTSGTFNGSATSNTVSLRVDEVLDVAVAGPASSAVLAGSGAAALAFTITNTGNGPEAFRLGVDAAIAGNDFDAVVDQLALDSNGNGVFDAGVDQILAAGADTPAIAADASVRVFVLASLPAGAGDGQSSQLRLTAFALTGTGTPGTVFAAQGAGGGDAVVGASGGESAATASLAASLANVTLSKSVTVQDPFGGNQPVPGATLTYQITAAVQGTGSVQNLVIADGIPAGSTYVPGTLKLDGAALTDGADGDAGTGGASGISVTLPTVSGGTSKVVSFNVTVN